MVKAQRQVVLNDTTFEQAVLSLTIPDSLNEKDIQEYLEIKRLKLMGKSLREIGKVLNMHASTVSRKINRIG